MIKIVFSNNQYYIYDNHDFYGPYHSMAEAESNRKNRDINKKVELKEWIFIKNTD